MPRATFNDSRVSGGEWGVFNFLNKFWPELEVEANAELLLIGTMSKALQLARCSSSNQCSCSSP